MELFKEKTRAYALKNAVNHQGKAVQGAVISSLFNEGLKKEEVGKYAKRVAEIVKEINKLSLKEQEKEFEKLKEFVNERPHREGLPELPNVSKKGVIMRIAPSPSGALHIGHAMTACISFDYVVKYGGKFYVRIEDTNPENIYAPAYKLIEQDSKWLFNNSAIILIQSNRMKLYYEYAEKIIKKGFAYVCNCSSEEFKKLADAKKECPCRKNSIKENIESWKKMLDKEGYKEGKAVLRFKSSMNHKNPAMRDFPLARINLKFHPIQKKKYRVWPLMNLSVSVDDIELGMTHIIRAKEHRDNAERQKMIYECLGLKKKFPWTAFLGRYKFKDLELSATKITEGIKSGKYSGWDDPSLPTISSLRKKGYKPEAFWKFSEQVGLSESDKVMEKKEYFQLLDTFNKP